MAFSRCDFQRLKASAPVTIPARNAPSSATGSVVSSFAIPDLTGSYQAVLESETLGPNTLSFVTRFSCFSSEDDFDVDVDNALAITTPVGGQEPTVEVPTLGEFGIVVFGLLLVGLGWLSLARRRAAL